MKKTDWLALLFAFPQASWAQQQNSQQGPTSQQSQGSQGAQNPSPGQGTSPQGQSQQQGPMQQGPQQQYSPQGQSQQGASPQGSQQQWPQQWQGQSAAPAPAVPTASAVEPPALSFEQAAILDKIEAIQIASLELRARFMAIRAAREPAGLEGVKREIENDPAMRKSIQKKLSKRVVELVQSANPYDDDNEDLALTKAELARLKKEDLQIQELLSKINAAAPQ